MCNKSKNFALKREISGINRSPPPITALAKYLKIARHSKSYINVVVFFYVKSTVHRTTSIALIILFHAD